MLAALSFSVSAYAADGWGGSAALTSDYLVRGVTRSVDDPALQLDLHYATAGGFFAGASLSNSRVNAREHWDAELGAYLGYRYAGEHASASLLYSHYAYPWNAAGSEYDYDEVEAQWGYGGWLQIDVSYSPNYWRFVASPYRELISVAQEALAVNVQRTLAGRLSAAGGMGYAYLSGPNATGYVYLSAGLAYDIGHCSLSMAYVNTSSAAKALFYDNAASNRVVGTVIWRF